MVFPCFQGCASVKGLALTALVCWYRVVGINYVGANLPCVAVTNIINLERLLVSSDFNNISNQREIVITKV